MTPPPWYDDELAFMDAEIVHMAGVLGRLKAESIRSIEAHLAATTSPAMREHYAKELDRVRAMRGAEIPDYVVVPDRTPNPAPAGTTPAG